MSDTIDVTAKLPVQTWPTPDYCCVVPDDVLADEGAQGEFRIPIEQAPREIVDALVVRWLGNLYARRNEAAPFAKVDT